MGFGNILACARKEQSICIETDTYTIKFLAPDSDIVNPHEIKFDFSLNQKLINWTIKYSVIDGSFKANIFLVFDKVGSYCAVFNFSGLRKINSNSIVCQINKHTKFGNIIGYTIGKSLHIFTTKCIIKVKCYDVTFKKELGNLIMVGYQIVNVYVNDEKLIIFEGIDAHKIVAKAKFQIICLIEFF
jgi:hypothetical protein